ncbi:Hypothetical predicted protein [Octopus vulgaris]|uniref:Uncharacterized protein n=1 Tax=Octopus vulgaris TaxID=6645 RepID=A0AA36AND9_OCTVU|nr:Hypothetical predicted protein [Octopus vulgaris]
MALTIESGESEISSFVHCVGDARRITGTVSEILLRNLKVCESKCTETMHGTYTVLGMEYKSFKCTTIISSTCHNDSI